MSDEPTLPSGSDPDETVASASGKAGGRSGASIHAGSVIGSYRIVDKIGEGGMGLVFEAEQERPRRRVALKLIRGGSFADDLSIRLFEREAEMLGRLEHPAIAAIYEAGRTGDGQCYLALELVQGKTFDAYLHEHFPGFGKDSLRARLRLFLAVCDAVQYAHQRGVIHRDLKPSNVLVTDSAAAPGSARVKVLDFGLAKLAGATDQDAAGLSRVGTIRGTLAYMSPEQIAGNPDAIDIRSDVYSLGVILYQILAGELPYQVSSTSLLEAARTIAEAKPKPLSSLANAAAIDADLRTIVAKALAKVPDDRYASAAALRDDVERWLTDQPIQARPPSTSYQLRKLVARHRAAFAAGLAAIVLLIGFGVLMTLLYGRSEQNRARAVEAEANAATEAATAQQVSAFLTDLFEVSDPNEARGRQVTARELLDRGAVRIRTELSGSPEVQGRLMRSMGAVYGRLGLYQDARSLLTESVAKGQGLEKASALAELSTVESRLGKHEEARQAIEAALALEQPALAASAYPLLRDRIRSAAVLNDLGKYDDSKALFEATLPLLEATLPADSRDLAAARMNYANLLADLGQQAEARAVYERSLAAVERSLPPDHPLVANLLQSIATCYDRAGDQAHAKPIQERVIAIREKALGPDHHQTLESRENLAMIYSSGGDPASAVKVFEENVRRWERVLGPDHPNVAQTLSNLGYTYFLMERFELARQTLERALRIREAKLAPDDLNANLTRFNLANTYAALGRYAAAKPLYLRVIDVDARHMGENTEDVAEDLDAYENFLRKSGNAREAGAVKARKEKIVAALAAKKAAAPKS